jgi:putative ABC transport system substrate-binding protein
MELNYSGRQMNSRRAFLSAALALASARVAAQDKPAPKVHRIGVLDPVSLQANGANMDQFRKGLKELGYSEGTNLSIEYLSAEGRSERFARLAGELVRHNVALIVTGGTPATLAAKNASAGRVPVVTATVVDPVETGLVASLERPGGNVTGLAVDTADLEAKRLELLRALAPGRNRIAAIMDMGNPALGEAWKALQPAAKAQGVELELHDVRKPEDAARAFEAAVARKAGAALVRIGALTQASRRAIVEAAAKHKLPAIYASRQFVDAGGLASYGVNTPQMYYRAAAFVDKILKGAKPADLPMERPARFELVLNRLAAHRLGLVIPPDLLLKSDQVVG